MKTKLIGWGVGLLVAGLALVWLLSFPGSPYNLREMVGHRSLVGAALALLGAFLLGFGPPVWAGIRMVRCRRAGDGYLWGLVLLMHAALTYLLVRLTLPLETVEDLIGPATLGWPAEWERMLRFTALFAPFSLMTAGGAALIATMRSIHVRVFGRWLLFVLCVLPLSYWLVFPEASTTHIVELVAGRGHPAAALFILGWWFILAAGAAALSARIAGFVQQWPPVVAVLLLGLPVAYALIYLGTNQAINKYGGQFSALQFLLSADRSHYVTGVAFWFRYLLAYTGFLGLLVLAQLPLWLWVARGLDPRSSRPAVSGR